MRSPTIALALAASTVAGAVTGSLLVTYWWDFGEDEERWGGYILALYSALGAVVGLIAGGLALTATIAARELRRRGRRSG